MSGPTTFMLFVGTGVGGGYRGRFDSKQEALRAAHLTARGRPFEIFEVKLSMWRDEGEMSALPDSAGYEADFQGWHEDREAELHGGIRDRIAELEAQGVTVHIRSDRSVSRFENPPAKISRAEAAALIEKRLRGPAADGKDEKWHYGKQELRELLDAIYGEPKNKEEEL